jgi:cell division protein FtsQ
LTLRTAEIETESGVNALIGASMPFLPRGLRRHGRALMRAEWRVPRHFGLKATAVLYLATILYGVIAGGHLSGVIAAGTSAAGLSIAEVRITGQSETSELDVLERLEIGEGASLATFSVATARARVETLPWVDTATIRKVYPGGLDVVIAERTPYALWQHSGITSLIDSEGTVIVDAVAARYTGLPLIVGTDANERAVELVGLMGLEPELKNRIRAAVLVGARRWNLMFDNGVTVMLPENGADAALATLARLDGEGLLLSRDIAGVDLRLADQVVVRLTDEAVVKLDATLRDRARLAARTPGSNA